MFKKREKKIMFVGDNHLKGFKQHFTKRYPDHRFDESIVEKETIYDLKDRFKRDVVKEKPEIIFISIGTNDVKENLNSVYMGTSSSMERYEAIYRQIMEMALKGGIENVVLIEPFYVSTRRIHDAVRYDIQDKIFVVRRVASDYGFKIIPADGLLNQKAVNDFKMNTVTTDGMQLKDKGRLVIMDACVPILDHWRVR